MGHRSCRDNGTGVKRMLPLGCCNNLQAGEGQRHRAASIPCLQVQPWLQNPHKKEPGQELPWGSTGRCRGAVPGAAVSLLPSSRRGRWRLPGFWLSPRSRDAGAAARSALIELLLLQGDCYFIGLFLATQPG